MSEATERPEWKTDSAANVLRRFADAANRNLDGVLSDERLRIQASDLGAVVQAIDEVLRAVNTHEEAIGLLRRLKDLPTEAELDACDDDERSGRRKMSVTATIAEWRAIRNLLSRLDGGTP